VIPAETVGGSLTHHALDRHILEDILDEHLSGLQYVGIDQDIFNLANLLAIAGTDDRISLEFLAGSAAGYRSSPSWSTKQTSAHCILQQASAEGSL
jgi:hypothetical protein